MSTYLTLRISLQSTSFSFYRRYPIYPIMLMRTVGSRAVTLFADVTRKEWSPGFRSGSLALEFSCFNTCPIPVSVTWLNENMVLSFWAPRQGWKHMELPHFSLLNKALLLSIWWSSHQILLHTVTQSDKGWAKADPNPRHNSTCHALLILVSTAITVFY